MCITPFDLQSEFPTGEIAEKIEMALEILKPLSVEVDEAVCTPFKDKTRARAIIAKNLTNIVFNLEDTLYELELGG